VRDGETEVGAGDCPMVVVDGKPLPQSCLPVGEAISLESATQHRQYMKQIQNRSIIFMLVFAATLFVSAGNVSGKEVEGVIGRGEAAVVGITAEQGQLIALQRARADAVEQAAGTRVLGSTLVKDSMLVADFIKTFSRGFIVDEDVKWLPLGTFRENDTSAPIPVYRVQITATIMIPEKKKDPGFFLKASVKKTFYLSGENAVIKAKVSKKSHIAVFNIRADDRVSMLYPVSNRVKTRALQYSETFLFPSTDSGLVIEMGTLKGHKQDSEAFMVVAVNAEKNASFRFADYFSADRLYSVPEFFEIYSRFAEMAVEKILPYEVRKRER